MEVNNYVEFIDKTDFVQKRLLQVNSCGSERVLKYDYTILRSNGRRDYHFLYLLSGWLNVEVGTHKTRLESGQCAVFLPGVRQKYTFSAQGAPISLFLHFTGQAVAEAMQYLRPVESMVYTITDRALFESLFYRLNRVHNLQQTMELQILEENSILLQLIAIVCRSSIGNEKMVRGDILNAMEYIRGHMQEPINFQEFAKTLHLSYSRFTHLFSQIYGVSPQRYLMRLRMDRARGLLRDSSMSVAEIAEITGFHDPFYFSRIFSKTFGLSPRSFRAGCQKRVLLPLEKATETAQMESDG